ncbi:SDR family NAD(P)-dependent oxidoreductase, partial [Achromobacter sp.]
MDHSATDPTLSVIVTGGASGIGAAVCRRVVQAGGHVAILDLNLD